VLARGFGTCTCIFTDNRIQFRLITSINQILRRPRILFNLFWQFQADAQVDKQPRSSGLEASALPLFLLFFFSVAWHLR